MNVKNILILVLMITVLLGNSSSLVFAEELTTPTPEPTQVSTSTIQWPQRADKPEKADKPELATFPDAISTPTPTPSPVQNQISNEQNQTSDPSTDTSTGGNTNTDTVINTGDANNTSNINNTGNNNYATDGSGSASGTGSTSILNTGNGTDSSNTGSATILNNNDTNQVNSAIVVNTLNQSATTGKNDSSKNTGGDTTITTGDANVTGTILTSANTNVDGIAVSEFNIVDDHTGDFILDFNANCITGCTIGETNIANTGNGTGSTNTGVTTTVNNNNTDQVNNGDVTNNLTFNANSGDNTADKNTGGDTTITTGDANVAANLMTFLNNNIAGGVMFGVVNIFGNLVGDIILPENVFDQFNCGACTGDTNLANTSNGSGSTNLAGSTNVTNNDVFQSNDANIQNNLIFDANTGENSVDKNTDGNNSITTGNVLLDASILNLANMNMIGGNMWLVIINEAGNWVGKLFGAPTADGDIASSEGLSFAIDPNGSINVTNANNGAGSTNTGATTTVNNNSLSQTNTANVVNNVNLSANTGGNSASKNTGGNSSIITGDAQAIANIVNFVNNNIVGGKLLVTFVNVFGSWKGDFLTPGAKKDVSPVVAQGGLENNSNNATNNTTPSTQAGASVNTPNQVKAAIIGAFGFAKPNTNSTKISNGSNEVKVAGANNIGLVASMINGDSAKRQATINLAWLLLALPLIGGGMIAGKKYINRRSA